MGINYLCIIMEEDMEIVFEKYGKQTVCTNGVISTKQESPNISEFGSHAYIRRKDTSSS